MVLASTCSLLAAPEVHTLTGGPAQFSSSPAGYVDGDTATAAQFNTPFGIALDPTGNTLFVADRDNNAIRQLDLASHQTFTFTTNRINQPVGVAVDGDGKVYVLNRGNGNNGTVLTFDSPTLGAFSKQIIARVGFIEMRALTKVLSALRSDTRMALA